MHGVIIYKVQFLQWLGERGGKKFLMAGRKSWIAYCGKLVG
jgi:hypothetical protein